ncbi:hypothetical protein AGMMS49953_00130 [Endomicrobiia bacterium]|nr:hypothetical protein AGMMS49953_00130 [Endomicrobiia bacterium]
MTVSLHKYCQNTLKRKVKKDLFWVQIVYNYTEFPEKQKKDISERHIFNFILIGFWYDVRQNI